MGNSASTQYQITPNTGYHVVSLIGDLDQGTCGKFFEDMSATLTKAPGHVLINCVALVSMAPAWMRILAQLALKLKTAGLGVRMINVPVPVLAMLIHQGLDNVLKVAVSQRAALTDFGVAPALKLDVNFVNAFLSATVDVLKIQGMTAAVPGPITKQTGKERLNGDVSGVIGLVSEAFNGAIVISFPTETFLKIMSRMLYQEFTVLTKEIEDGAGELMNIIFGRAKIALNEKGYGIETALPSVITGRDHSVSSIANGIRVVVPFKTDVGDFFVAVCLSA